ncbi:MBL fold metallo-hydrolase [Bradyrhizobium sp. UFLA01-814]|uniref:MBL fold metallo-hydrolase n=1 Tax=Bradyrhizobium sp. UFLA01-814 TaxID=3023480 RepID=UPI00398AA4A9
MEGMQIGGPQWVGLPLRFEQTDFTAKLEAAVDLLASDSEGLMRGQAKCVEQTFEETLEAQPPAWGASEVTCNKSALILAAFCRSNAGRCGLTVAIGENIAIVQRTFKKILPAFATNGSQFDQLFKDGEAFRIGKLEGRAIHTPGHTPACVTYVIGDAAFVGDTLFMPDYGTGRCDFPGGDAHMLYRSIRKLFALPAQTRLYICHDYQPGGRAPLWQSTIAEQRERNVHVHDGVGEEEFVAMRNARDNKLDMPLLMFPAVQFNMWAGQLPRPEDNGVSYLKTPLNQL